jgi:hypothetical protein
MPSSSKYKDGYRLPIRDRVLVVIGANGSGKTRFGVWLEKQNVSLHHRVSAHRALIFPERVQPADFEEAQRELYYGSPTADDPVHYRQHSRWQNNPATALLNDYAVLVKLILSESFTVSDNYRVSMIGGTGYVEPPKTRMDLIKEIWESVLPDRELVVKGNSIETRNKKDSSKYHAKEMSDGERGVFYLIGEALSVPKDGLFIVDEPELHLHRAIQARLWDAIEAARPDCMFVYITHDLGFATSRCDASKIWLREYCNSEWDWEEVPESCEIPEPLLLEVIGSRRPVLFVEGDRNSLDYLVYGKMFPDHTVIPCGSCEVVLHSVRTLAEFPNLHYTKCCGIVDNDGRPPEEIRQYEKWGVSVLSVAIIENLFMIESVLIFAAQRLGHNPVVSLSHIRDCVFEKLEENATRIASSLTRKEVEMSLKRFGQVGDGKNALSEGFQAHCQSVKPDMLYDKWESEIARVCNEKDYGAALRYYNIKGLHAVANAVFSMNYKDQMLRWLRSDECAGVVDALRSHAPAVCPQRK